MIEYKPIAESTNFIILDKYIRAGMVAESYQSENDQVVADGIVKFTGIEVPINLLQIVVDAVSHLPEEALKRLPHSFIHDATQVDEQATNECEGELLVP